ncbi:hypothetical protein [Roseiconus lacunae]|uniref:hypothetical protein n=2 Tax=Roseiconus lacunae TaxID=2605694 RepID=UPI00135B98BB|nr:hypothetical protein [Roseiconus lacunae]
MPPSRWNMPALLIVTLLATELLVMDRLAPAVAYGQFTDFYTAGHADLGIEYNASLQEFETHLHVGRNAIVNGVPLVAETVYDLETTLVTSDGFAQRPDDSGLGFAFAPLGIETGEHFWWLPQNYFDAVSGGDDGLPHLGWSANAAGTFVDDQLTLALVDVMSPSGIGLYSLWSNSGISANFVHANFDGIDASDALTLATSGHDHFNLAFADPNGLTAAEGLWTITYGVEGELLTGETISSTFRVNYWIGNGSPVPEPSFALAFVGLAMAAMVPRKRRHPRHRR